MVSTILITGANRGLGLGLASLYADDGWQVIGCCRDPVSATELQALVARSSGRFRVERLDVENLADIDALAQRLDGLPLDILCNVAGYYGGKIFSDPGGLYPFGSTDYAEWERVFRINVMGPMRMAEALIENVAASGQRKIVSLSSITGSIGANVDGYMYGYRSSKSALNSIMKSMAIELADRGVIAVPLHPGSVRTDMGGPSSDIDVIESVTKMKGVIDALTLEQSGTFLVYDGSTLPW